MEHSQELVLEVQLTERVISTLMFKKKNWLFDKPGEMYNLDETGLLDPESILCVFWKLIRDHSGMPFLPW